MKDFDSLRLFTPTYYPIKSYNIRLFLHDAFQTYLHYFNTDAAKNDDMPIQCYHLAKKIKADDDTDLDMHKDFTNPNELLDILWASSYYLHLIEHDTHTDITESTLYYSKKYALRTMLTACTYIHNHYNHKMLNATAKVIDILPISKNIMNRCKSKLHL